MKQVLVTVEQRKERAITRDDIQDWADSLNTRVSAQLEDENGLEQVVFTPRAWAQNNQPKLFED